MLPEQLLRATEDLAALGPQKVWSLLVTVFGDLAQSKGQGIEGPILSMLMADMHVKPEATRVALHRLRNDNWITSEKHGRTSLHGLTDHGRAVSAAASPRIYATPLDVPTGWQVIVLESATAHDANRLSDQGFARLAPRIYVGAAQTKPPKGALALPADHMPDWLSAQFEPQDIAKGYGELHAALEAVDRALPGDHSLSARDTAVLRCHIVHSWRRLVLRHPMLPRALYSQDWRGHECQALVASLLFRLPKPKLNTIC